MRTPDHPFLYMCPICPSNLLGEFLVDFSEAHPFSSFFLIHRRGSEPDRPSPRALGRSGAVSSSAGGLFIEISGPPWESGRPWALRNLEWDNMGQLAYPLVN